MLLLRLPGGEQGGPGVQRRQQRGRRRGRRCAGRLLLLLLCACCCCCCCTGKLGGALLQQIRVVGPAGGGSGQEALAIRRALAGVRGSDPPLGRVWEPVTAQAAAAAAAQGLLDSERGRLKVREANRRRSIRFGWNDETSVLSSEGARPGRWKYYLSPSQHHRTTHQLVPGAGLERRYFRQLCGTRKHAASGAANTRSVLVAFLEECPGRNNPWLSGSRQSRPSGL